MPFRIQYSKPTNKMTQKNLLPVLLIKFSKKKLTVFFQYMYISHIIFYIDYRKTVDLTEILFLFHPEFRNININKNGIIYLLIFGFY
jgi:hypothetical protein